MIDIIVPKKVDLIKSKEMHGHVILDIHNTRSGFTERIEKHNTVTTAANEFMWLNYLAILRSGGGYRPTSLYEGILGGVCLFTDTISGGTMLPLGNNHLVGYAGTSTTLSGNRGVFNESESSFNVTSGTATSVWDWSTSQANGTIGSVARTNYNIGDGNFGVYSHAGTRFGIYSPQDLDHSSSTLYNVVGFDKANGIAYLYYESDQTYYKYNYYDTLSVKAGTMSAAYIPESSSMLTSVCTSSLSGATRYRWFDVDNQIIYVAVPTTTGTSSDGTMMVYSVDVTAGTPEETSTEVTMAGCYLYTTDAQYTVITDGYIYSVGYDPDDVSRYGIYQLNISDNTINFFSVYDVIENASYTSTNVPIQLCPWGTGGVGCVLKCRVSSTDVYREILFDQDGTSYFDEPGFATSASSARYYGFGLGAGADVEIINIFRDYNGLTWYWPGAIGTTYDYLGTYCNLDEAITKTTSETLKLTYTLSDS